MHLQFQRAGWNWMMVSKGFDPKMYAHHRGCPPTWLTGRSFLWILLDQDMALSQRISAVDILDRV